MSPPDPVSAPQVRAHHLPAAGAVTLAVALLVLLPEALGDLGRLAAVLVLQLGLALAWVLATGVQGFAGSLTVGAAAAVAADLALVLPERHTLGGLAVVFGVAFLAVVFQQMFRRPRPELVASLSGTLLLCCAIGALAALLLLGRGPGGSGRAALVLLAVGGALVAGHLVDLVLPRPHVTPGVPRGLPGLAAGVLVAAAGTFLGRGLSGADAGPEVLAHGAVLGLVAGLTGLAASYLVVDLASPDRVGTEDGASAPWVLAVVQAGLPLAACAPVALALQNLL